MIKLKKLALSILLTMGSLHACAEGNFSADGLSKSKNNCGSDKANCKSQKVPIGDVIGKDETGPCLKKAPVIDFILVMDVSGSMQPQNDQVNAAFSGLASNLSNLTIEGLGKVPTVRFGLITYDDIIQFEAPMSSNISDVRKKISEKFKAVQKEGGDASEGGLMAATKGLGLARGNNDSVKVMFLVTDAFSHDGTPAGANSGTRNYDPKDVNAVLTDPSMQLTFIYTASPKSGGNKSPFPEPPFANAVQQWSEIRSNAASAAGRAQLGKDYDVFKFTTTEVSDDIPRDIANQLRKCI